MVAKKQNQPATYDDILAAPEHMVAELLNGELYLSPRPKPRHSRAASRLGMSLGGFDGDAVGEGFGGWWIFSKLELHLDSDVMVPDLAGWRRERLPVIPDTQGIELAPDWVCEVASPSTRRHDRMIKAALYLEHGVRWMWLVTPNEETVEVFEQDGGRWVLAKTAVGDEPARLPPFDATELDVGAWWQIGPREPKP
ncbi:MAG TPA: Uma2 family endonuclease [Myxococcota bacterium]|nr:Uma2 family endonuclease [Myxococcota bacterium]